MRSSPEEAWTVAWAANGGPRASATDNLKRWFGEVEEVTGQLLMEEIEEWWYGWGVLGGGGALQLAAMAANFGLGDMHYAGAQLAQRDRGEAGTGRE
jgi:hypothetical protein